MKKNQKKCSAKKINKKNVDSFEVIRPNTAGIDIGNSEHWVSVPPANAEDDIRRFGAFTCNLYEIANWLRECNIKYVAMEATGIYWIPLFQVLEERGFEVSLINARHVKVVDARGKTDRLDCHWIRRLHSCGLLTPSFRPEPQICKIRTLMRHRDNLIKMKSKHTLHMQKSLNLMNIKLGNVLSDIMGVTGTNIIKSILSGERNIEKLAALKDFRVKASHEEIVQSLTGDYRDEHLFNLQLSFDAFEFAKKQIVQIDRKIETLLIEFDQSQQSHQLQFSFTDENDSPVKPKTRKRKSNDVDYDIDHYLQQITRTDLTAIPGIKDNALLIISEIGLDMSKFPSSKHFVSWLGLNPQLRISGGKVLSNHTAKVKSRAANAFRTAAATLRNSHCYLGAFYRKISRRKSPSCAITATARKIAVIFYNMLKYQSSYRELGEEYLRQHHKNQSLKNIKKIARSLGYEVTLTEIS